MAQKSDDSAYMAVIVLSQDSFLVRMVICISGDVV